MAEKPTRYEVIEGIFKGHKFKGHPVTINGEARIWDDNSVGHAYPAINCKEIPNV